MAKSHTHTVRSSLFKITKPHGHDVSFHAGDVGAEGGSFTFKIARPDGTGENEVLRMEANGDVFVYGEQVDRETDGQLIYGAFKAWVAGSLARF